MVIYAIIAHMQSGPTYSNTDRFWMGALSATIIFSVGDAWYADNIPHSGWFYAAGAVTLIVGVYALWIAIHGRGFPVSKE